MMTPSLSNSPALAWRSSSAKSFAAVALTFECIAAFLAGWLPLSLSIVTVFLFAAPHNLMEARYFIQRMPARWGKLRNFFLLGIGGVLVLSIAFVLLSSAVLVGERTPGSFITAWSSWNTLLILWVTALMYLRSRTNPRRDWSWMPAVAALLIGVSWIAPQLWGVALVYLHPLIGFWILDRELRRTRPEWRAAYHLGLSCVPVFLAALWCQSLVEPRLINDASDALATLIVQHSGAEILRQVPTRLLVTTHVFLETLHYGVWLAAIPSATFGVAPWKLAGVPLVRRSPRWRRIFVSLSASGTAIVVLFWIAFLVNYTVTYDLYFTLAMVHVLAEVPFLLRSL
jgi:hypothetical protein